MGAIWWLPSQCHLIDGPYCVYFDLKYFSVFRFCDTYFTPLNNIAMELKKLTEENLTRQPEEVFDILCKLGKGSYGSVYKAIHKDSQQILAIKQVPVDNDLQEIIKEISIMQQCDSPYVVKYYGSYFKNTGKFIQEPIISINLNFPAKKYVHFLI